MPHRIRHQFAYYEASDRSDSVESLDTVERVPGQAWRPLVAPQREFDQLPRFRLSGRVRLAQIR
jgi:hypothetical protein